MSFRLLLTAAAFSLSAAPALAERSVYVGVGADYAAQDDDALAVGSFIAGATFNLWENMGLGLEGEVGEPIGGSADDRETARVRGLFTYDFGGVTGIASLGSVQYEQGSQTFDGETFGLGAQLSLSERWDGRVEVMHDFNDDDFDENVTTGRVALFFKF